MRDSRNMVVSETNVYLFKYLISPSPPQWNSKESSDLFGLLHHLLSLPVSVLSTVGSVCVSSCEVKRQPRKPNIIVFDLDRMSLSSYLVGAMCDISLKNDLQDGNPVYTIFWNEFVLCVE